MLSDADIVKFMNAIPPIPKVVKACSDSLNSGDLVKAAKFAEQDLALIGYLKQIVNKPIFGFKDDIKDAKQIFGILGLSRAKQILDSYYVHLMAPRQWNVFDLDTKSFHDLQANMLVRWERLLNNLNVNDIECLRSVTLIPATVVVCEEVFKSHKEIIDLIRLRKSMSYEEILIKTTDRTFFDIAFLIARKWEMSQEVMNFMLAMKDPKKDIKNSHFVGYLTLLIEYELSRPKYIKSGLNSFFELEIEHSQNTVKNFLEVMKGVA